MHRLPACGVEEAKVNFVPEDVFVCVDYVGEV